MGVGVGGGGGEVEKHFKVRTVQTGIKFPCGMHQWEYYYVTEHVFGIPPEHVFGIQRTGRLEVCVSVCVCVCVGGGGAHTHTHWHTHF